MKRIRPVTFLNNKLLPSKKTRINLFLVGSWMLAANVFIVLKAWGVADQTGYLIFTKPENLFLAHVMATLMGLLVGMILLVVDNHRLQPSFCTKGLGATIMVKGISYVFTIMLVVQIVSFSFLLILGSGPAEAIQRHLEFISSAYFVSIIAYSSAVALFISFIRQVDTKFGPGNLFNMLIGRYQSPKVEDRIFMFLDLKNSTPYAEKLGHLKYSRMLQDCFRDIARVVNKYSADIYQYVGDEIVLTWKSERGLSNLNCLRLFFSFRDTLVSRSNYYINKYGIVPEFKAGLNCGHVTVAEIGSFKREIAYHGDVINTASRIQCQCNSYGKKLLASGQLIKRLSGLNGYDVEFTASARLKGKKLPVEIYSVEAPIDETEL